MRKTIVAALVAALTLALAIPAFGRSSKATPVKGSDSIATIAGEAGFTELVGALIYVDAELGTNLVGLFSEGTDQYTVFAPTNAAFQGLYSDLGVGGIEDLDAELVLDVLLYHVTDGRRAANSVVPKSGERTITSLMGAKFTVDSGLDIDDLADRDADIVSANISASNGIIHVIDDVILPLG